MARRMPRFREWPTTRTAAIGLLIVTGALVFAFVYPTLPIVQGTTYTAEFSDAGGLKVDDEVWVAGINVGKVVKMELDGTKVNVTFTAKDIRLGTDSQAGIKTATLLGKRFVGLTPGTGPEQDSSEVIPLARTSTPYNVSRSLEDVTAQLRDFDKPKLEEALNVFANTFKDTPKNFRDTFENVKRLSITINSRDQALRELLTHANVVSKVLADRTGDFEAILLDGNRLLAELQSRRELFKKLFDDFNYVATQARDFVKENNDQLKDTLDELNEVLGVLEKNNANLAVAIQRVAGFITGLGEGIANGPSFSAVVGLHTVGDITTYPDVLRTPQNGVRVPGRPGLPGGLGSVPNPLDGPPSGNNADRPTPIDPTDSGHPTGPDSSNTAGGLPLLGGN